MTTTTQIIQRFAKEHGISTIRSMVVLAELLDIEKRSTGMDREQDCIPEFSLEQIGW